MFYTKTNNLREIEPEIRYILINGWLACMSCSRKTISSKSKYLSLFRCITMVAIETWLLFYASIHLSVSSPFQKGKYEGIYFASAPLTYVFGHLGPHVQQENCAIAKTTARCALYIAALKIFESPWIRPRPFVSKIWSSNVTDTQADRQTDDMQSQYRALHHSAWRGKNEPTKFAVWNSFIV